MFWRGDSISLGYGTSIGGGAIVRSSVGRNKEVSGSTCLVVVVVVADR